MKSAYFFLILLALVFSTATLQAQTPNSNALASPATSGMTQFDAYKMNFEAAVNQGNTDMANPHRMKLVNFMDRDIQASEAADKPVISTAKTSSKTKTTVQNPLARKKEIADIFRNMDLSTPAALQAAKTQLGLITEFGQLMAKPGPATN